MDVREFLDGLGSRESAQKPAKNHSLRPVCEPLSAKTARPEPARRTKTAAEKVRAVETEAVRLGWRTDALWQTTGLSSERGLVTLIHPDQEITEVTGEYVRLTRTRADGRTTDLRFFNLAVGHSWLGKPTAAPTSSRHTHGGKRTS